ncbi:hypothetical protein ABZW02_36210, partial [Streptomyces sp. NPDC005180]|uniref:hypothetical protein n=1 Tax=Streptomyces sp. NPDC005180 TaxID=3156868 RepID=UPI0033B8E660
MSGTAPAPTTATIAESVATSTMIWWSRLSRRRASWPDMPPLRVSMAMRRGSAAAMSGNSPKESLTIAYLPS